MALVLADRVLETTIVAGTGDAALGGAVVGYQPFSTIGDGSTTYYTIVAVDDNGAPTGDWEVGIGTYILTGNKISRDTVLSSSNGGALVYFPSGTKQIFLDLPSEEVLLTAGDVYGPASAVNNNFAAFNLTTGKLIKDSGFSSASFATAAQGAKADTAVQPGDLGTAAYLDAGVANGVATLDSGGKVPASQIPQMGDLNYQGTWNASTNTPTLTSSSGTKGFYYVVSVAGNTNLNGITDWLVGDWAVYNGSIWQKIDNTDLVTSVNGYTGTVVLTATDVGAAPATSGTSILYGNGFGGTSNVTVGTGLSFSAGTLSATGSMVYPSAGIAYSTGTAWGTSYTTTGTGTVVALQTSPLLVTPTLSGALVDNSAPYIDWANGSAVTLAAGRMWYNGTTGSWNLGMGGGNITQQVGEELFIYGKASSAVSDTNLQLCYKTGTVGASGVLTFAPTISGLTDPNVILGVATESIATNAFGRITSYGIVHGINTSGSNYGETWADGDVIWYNPVTGGLTKTKPVAPNMKTEIGVVLNAGSGGSGSFQVEIIHGTALGGTDSNAQITSVANGQILTYDGGNGYWKNTSLTAGTAISVSTSANGVLTITNSAPDQVVSLTGAGTTTVTGTYPSFTITSNDAYTGTVTSVTGTAPISVATGTTTPVVSMTQSSGSTNGWLSSTDWTTFSAKLTNPMTTLGDVIYGAASGTATRLAGNITAAKQFLSQTGTGSASAAPVWSALPTVLPVLNRAGSTISVAVGNGVLPVLNRAGSTVNVAIN